MWAERRTAADIVAKEGLAQVSDGGELEAACRKVIAAHPAEAASFKANPKLMGFFVGAVMKETGGKANPKAVNEILRKLLGLTSKLRLHKLRRFQRGPDSNVRRHFFRG